MAKSDQTREKQGDTGVALQPSPVLPRSIAVSVIIHPSRSMLIACGGFALLCVLISFAVFFEQAGAVSLFARIFVLAAGIASAILIGMQYRQTNKSWALDISGASDLRISPFSKTNDIGALNSATQRGEIGYLAAGTLITPILLVLRLADSHDNINTLLVFPDSLTQDAFRRLSVACRWHSAQRQSRTRNVF